MKKIILTMFLTVIFYPKISAQNIVKGLVVDGITEKPLVGVSVSVQSYTTKTTTNGTFVIENLSKGKFILTLELKGYETQKFSIELDGLPINLGSIYFYENLIPQQDTSIITITDDELDNDGNTADNIAGLLQSTKDIFLRTAAFEFSPSFFRIRGQDSENATLLINGIEMNKLYSGRPQWSNWGGLNDVLRNQVFSSGLQASSYTFGGVLGSTNIIVRASEAWPGLKITYSSSNKSYTNRVMANYASGLTKKGWAFTLAASKRFAVEGFSEGTIYDASSFFAAVEKKINAHHSINFTGIMTPNVRGKSSPNTEEVFHLKGIKYNAYWGLQNDKIRNSRIKEIIEPIFMLNHYWTFNDYTTLNTNIAYQFGKVSNSRIDHTGSKIDGEINGIPTIVSLGGSNPDPTYYQKLPSYALRQGNPDVYELEQDFLNNGQLDWKSLYSANLNPLNNGNAAYILYEDRTDDRQLTFNSIFDTTINENFSLNAKVQYKKFESENYAKILDLLGGTGFLDVDNFASDYTKKQNDVLHPNRVAVKGDVIKYNYSMASNFLSSFVQAQFKYRKLDFFFSGKIATISYQRDGKFRNGKFTNDNESFGKSRKETFTNFGIKTGATYKISGRHLFNFNAAYLTKAPTIKNVFSNARLQNDLVENLASEKIVSADASYILRTPFVQAKVTGFFTSIKDATEVSFYYADGIGGSGSEYSAFVQEILTNINKQYFGVEIGVDTQVTTAIKLKAAANLGQYIYANNPTLTLKSESDAFQFSSRLAHLKNYKLAAGPQKAGSIGFEYRDPEYWWIGATANFFDDVYVDINPLTRTNNFSDDGSIPFHDYDPEIAKTLLLQEKFDSYAIINLSGGKTWKINDYYIGLFASVNNLLNTQYKTGGFEQGRNANYREVRDDKALKKPVFGNKYWYGRGTTYFLNINIRL